MAIVKVVEGDIHKSKGNNRLIAMNDEGNTMYGLVADAIKQGLFDNMQPVLEANGGKLGTIASFQGSGSVSDATYHAAIIHDFDAPDQGIAWNLAAGYLGEAINNSPLVGQDVDAVLIGSGLGQYMKANIKNILEAMDASEANITLYIKPTSPDHLAAMQEPLVEVLGEERGKMFFDSVSDIEAEGVFVGGASKVEGKGVIN